ncbi:hypothetical protein VOLCADRAFT_99151 [Volvox carteri f. nagariensis]|uniref:BHLH domain-containing protein n=1 Tax=Volvox carteri f. nagariensis TaxID=3068 RepID=D8UH43_VOLCA|nr:uncharacterized protein VOLCADRAFT_99151 [Volvox carteri f. nagariensis]EFJ40979.1 hypothetical protein VOLCADRAFT_99151 [Volvox carteri f. nagariensis]|eukprot:XP_002957953.1 hypothetical protein VOLCADRAFT_99151 [Volvox carteri f. nagariensis]
MTMTMQAAFEDFRSQDDVDTDMHDLFFLLSAASDSTDDVSEPPVEGPGCPTSQHDAPSPLGSSPENYCFPGMLRTPCDLPADFMIKQEPVNNEAVGHVEHACEMAQRCTSSSSVGCPPSANTAATSGGSPFQLSALSISFPGTTPEPPALPVPEIADQQQHQQQPPPQEQPQRSQPAGPSCHNVTSLNSTPNPEYSAVAAAAALPGAAGLSELDDIMTRSDSMDALYDAVRSKSSRSFGRTSSKKPPMSHSTIEKHRRDRINHLIEELGEMVPPLDPRYRGEGVDASAPGNGAQAQRLTAVALAATAAAAGKPPASSDAAPGHQSASPSVFAGDCTAAPAAVQTSPHASDTRTSRGGGGGGVSDGTGLTAALADSGDPWASDGSVSSSTEVHVCRTSTAAAKPKPFAAAAAAVAATPSHATSSRTPPPCTHQHQHHHQRPGREPAPPRSPDSSITPGPPSTATAADAATSSWLVRVVCPPRKDLLAAACTALSDAGVSLRSARTTSAAGGRMALELEDSADTLEAAAAAAEQQQQQQQQQEEEEPAPAPAKSRGCAAAAGGSRVVKRMRV